MIEISDVLEVKNHIEGLKAVIFDLDDTLYSEKEYVRSGYQKIAEILPEVENAAEKLWTLFEAKKPAIDELLKMEEVDAVITPSAWDAHVPICIDAMNAGISMILQEANTIPGVSSNT